MNPTEIAEVKAALTADVLSQKLSPEETTLKLQEIQKAQIIQSEKLAVIIFSDRVAVASLFGDFLGTINPDGDKSKIYVVAVDPSEMFDPVEEIMSAFRKAAEEN